ncbi:site-specific integrase [Sulfurimonas crateris]|uniref:Site-specific integrase n=1 Tax=Sulfurimonas crateris TaxID=2574727 RepID=A0A4U2Z8X3_9BACT|nr:site-specific integrase [Sulfurimonas crateris]TKI70896.1 site-specific integrase [Sulfurimonas crateris]
MADTKDIQYDKDYPTKYDGVYFRYSKKKKYNGKPDKSFKIRYRVNGRSKNERIGWQSDGYSAEFAKNIRAERIVAIRHGGDLPNTKKLIFKEAAKRYLDDHSSKKSIREDRYRYNDLKHLDDMEISDITISDLKKVHAVMRARGVKHITYIKVEEFYNKVVKYASEINLIKPQPSLKIPIPRAKEKLTEIYTDEMLQNYLSIIEQYPYRIVSDIVELIYYTGMRRSEPLKIKWSDYNKEEKSVIIRDAKSGRDERKLLSSESINIIERQRGKSKVYIFENGNEPVRAQYLSYHSRRIADMAGIPSHYRPLHSLRHNVGTRMALQGTPAAIIKEFLNHKNLETTQRYIDIAEPVMQGHIDMLESGLKKSSKVSLNIKRVDTEVKNG